MESKSFLKFALVHLLAPFLVGVAAWGVTKSCDNRTINGLTESIQSLDNTIKAQRDSLDAAHIHIDSLNWKWQKFQKIMGVAIDGNVDNSIVIGTMNADTHDDALQKIQKLQELLNK